MITLTYIVIVAFVATLAKSTQYRFATYSRGK